MAYIQVIEPEAAEGDLQAEYALAAGRAGKVFNILKIQSLNAAALHASMALYVASMRGTPGLSRGDREMLATVVSQLNDCFY